MKTSPYFSLDELCHSQTATRRGISNQPNAEHKANLEALVQNILHPIRVHFRAPVIVTSGYRSPALNRAIGGSRTSQHSLGQAADFTVLGKDDLEVAQWIAANLPHDQLILEFPPQGWVHCSFGPRHRREELTAKRGRWGRTIYRIGLNP